MQARKNNWSDLPGRWSSLWIVAGAFLIGFSLLCLVLIMLLATRKSPASAAEATAIFIVINAPTDTQSAASLVPNSTGSPSEPPPPPEGVIAIGTYVQITGTSGDGLRFRAEPGLSSQVLLVGSEAEVFQVDDGPREVDGYTWWHLVGPFDETRNGWAVANYLVVTQGP
jgi:hypothetical protein